MMRQRDRIGGGERRFLLCLAASLYGLALIWSATRYDAALHGAAVRQAAALGLGAALCRVLPLLDLRRLLERAWPLLAAGETVLLLLLIPLGNEDGTGNRSWIALPGGVFNLQPAELVKVSFLLLLSLQLDRLDRRGRLGSLPGLLLPAGHALALCGLLFAVSGDMGMVAVYLGIYLAAVWGAGVRPLWLVLQLAAGAGGAVLLWPRLPEYVRIRFLVVLDHELDPLGKGFQQGRSLLAIGSGQLTGQGYLQGLQTQSAAASSLPARHTDLIFAAAGEELGLLGCLVILALLAGIVWSCAGLARGTEDRLLRAAALGAAGMFGFQTLCNVGMCLYVAPVIGVTLPFFSYGGSSLLSSFLMMGVLEALAVRGKG